MLAAHDQENLAHTHQTAAAAKPLNQGVKGYGSKTPANKAPKTPFKIPLNDENAILKTGKTAVKATNGNNENFLPLGKKGGDVDKNAFITPAGPRARAPLGMKTTNAKAKAFQTPAPLTIERGTQKTQKHTSPRLRRAKIRIHQAEATKEPEEDEEREIEYMPPRGEPLPDCPDDWPNDMEYPMFEGKNLTRGMFSTYYNPEDIHGVTYLERKEAEDKAKYDKLADDLLQKALEADGWNLPDRSGADTVLTLRQKRADEEGKKRDIPPKSSNNAKTSISSSFKPLTTNGPPTMSSKTAVSVLSQPPKSSTPSFAAPTASAKAKAPASSALVNRKARQMPAPTNPSSMRHTAATAASRTTLGYSQGRATSSSLRKPIAVLGQRRHASTPVSSRKATDPVAKPSDDGQEPGFERLLMMRDCQGSEDDIDNELLGRHALGKGIIDEDVLEDFVLKLPEGL